FYQHCGGFQCFHTSAILFVVHRRFGCVSKAWQIRVYDEAGNRIETCESEGDLKAWQIKLTPVSANVYITITLKLRMRKTQSSLFNQLLLSSLDLTVRPV